MKRVYILSVILLFCKLTSAQQKFISVTSDSTFGTSLRIFPAQDRGWFIFSMDSLKISKINTCGISQWGKHYNIPNTTPGLNDIVQTSDGGFVLLTRNQVDSTIFSSLLTRLDPAGEILWSKMYGNSTFSQFPYTISTDTTGNLFLFTNVEYPDGSPPKSMMCKIDPDGNLIWSRMYDHGHSGGGAITTTDNGLLMCTGNIFIKTDSTGYVQWTIDYFPAANNFTVPVEVSDGYIFSGYDTSTMNIIFSKIDFHGNILLNGQKKTDMIGIPSYLKKKDNGNLVGVFNRYSATENFASIIEFDSALNVVSQTSIKYQLGGINLFGTDICFLTDGTPVLAGNSSGGYMFYTKMDSIYRSGCDTILSNINILTDSSSTTFVNTTVDSTILNESNEQFTYDAFSMSQNTICNTPKQMAILRDTILCKDEKLQLKNLFFDLFDSYQWSTGETTDEIEISQPGTYWVSALDECDGTPIADTSHIGYAETIPVNLGEDIVRCENTIETITGPDCDSCKYTWSTGIKSKSIDLRYDGTYWLKVSNFGCVSSDSIHADFTKCECRMYVPNSFTPNNDGANEVFLPVYYCDFAEYNMKIVDRWGQVVFSTDVAYAGWNGKINNVGAPESVYLYIITYNPLNKGEPTQTVVKKGMVVLVR